MKYGFKITILYHIPKALHVMTACKLNSPAPALLLSPNQCLPPPTAQPFQDAARHCRLSILTPALRSLHPPWPRVLLSIHEHRPEPGTHPPFFLLRFILSLGWIFASSCQAAPTSLENALLHCLPLSSVERTLALLTILPDLTLPASPVTGYHPCLTLHMPISAQFPKLILLFHIALTWPIICLSLK